MGGGWGDVFCGLKVFMYEITLINCALKLWGEAPAPGAPPLPTPLAYYHYDV